MLRNKKEVCEGLKVMVCPYKVPLYLAEAANVQGITDMICLLNGPDDNIVIPASQPERLATTILFGKA